MADRYPPRECDVEVTFTDGQVQSYRIPTSATIAQYLAKTAGETGILTLLAGYKAFNIPVGQIREWTITELPQEASS